MTALASPRGPVVDRLHMDLSAAGLLGSQSTGALLREPAKGAEARLVWRGMLRGPTRCTQEASGACRCHTEGEAGNVTQLSRWPRYRLLAMARRFPEELAAGGRCSLLRRAGPGACGAAAAAAPAWLAEGHADEPGFSWRDYLLHASVDAAAYNTLANWRPLLLGRVLVKQSSDVRTAWFRRGLRPFVHYIPVRFDLADLRSRVRAARASPNETERIRKAGFAFGLRFLSRCQLYARLHLATALERYATLQAW